MIRLTITVDYNPDPQSYRAGTTPEQMAEIEANALAEDPSMLMWYAENHKVEVKGEIL